MTILDLDTLKNVLSPKRSTRKPRKKKEHHIELSWYISTPVVQEMNALKRVLDSGSIKQSVLLVNPRGTLSIQSPWLQPAMYK